MDLIKEESNMEHDKKTIIDCPPVVDERNLSKENDGCRERSLRKRRIIIVLSLLSFLLICILVAAIVLYALWTTKIQLQEKEHKRIGDKDVEQELYQDTVDSLTYYHVKDNTMEMWVILDYNREIEILKVMKNDSSSNCYISPRDTSRLREQNQTTTTIPITATTPSPKGNDSLPVLQLRPSTRSVREKSILGRRGQDLCKDSETFWILSSCDPTGASGDNGRVSRVRRFIYTFYTCYWDWKRCHYIIFPDVSYMRYYGCDWTCGYLTYQY